MGGNIIDWNHLDDYFVPADLRGSGLGVGGLIFTIHKKFSPLFISLKFWVIH